MKKRGLSILVLITCIFAAFLAGFAAGRNLNRAPVRIYQIERPTIAVSTEPASEAGTGPAESGIVNINTATAADFETLPGIGPVLAGRIVAYREEHGPFQAIEELTKVKGIGTAKLEEILDLITVGG